MRHARAYQRADQGVGAGGGDAEIARNDLPGNRANQSAKNHLIGERLRGYDSAANRVRDMKPEDQERDEIEERRPRDGITGREYAGGNDRGDRIGSIVAPVQEVENERNGNQPDQEQHPALTSAR